MEFKGGSDAQKLLENMESKELNLLVVKKLEDQEGWRRDLNCKKIL